MVYILRSGHLDHDYDDSIYTIGIIDAYKSLLINEQYYGQGYFELQAPATKANINLLLPGNYVVREEDVNRENMMLSVSANLSMWFNAHL